MLEPTDPPNVSAQVYPILRVLLRSCLDCSLHIPADVVVWYSSNSGKPGLRVTTIVTALPVVSSRT